MIVKYHKPVLFSTLVAIFLIGCVSQKNEKLSSGAFTDDRDGKEYTWVKMNDGNVWMADNLNFQLAATQCYDDKKEHCDKYGQLYGWESLGSICPEGWRVPTDKEWWNMVTEKPELYSAITMYPLGQKNTEIRFQELTKSENGLSIGFGGAKSPEYGSLNIENIGYYWTISSHKEDTVMAWYYGFDRNNKEQESLVVRVATSKDMMFSCRCVKE